MGILPMRRRGVPPLPDRGKTILWPARGCGRQLRDQLRQAGGREKETIVATPRVFISSTFYDLKYVREDLDRFIRAMGYDPM